MPCVGDADGVRVDFGDGESEDGVGRRRPRRRQGDASNTTWSGDAEQKTNREIR